MSPVMNPSVLFASDILADVSGWTSGILDSNDTTVQKALDTLAPLPSQLLGLDDAEIQQVQNIDSVTISNSQWGYLGAMSGQPVETETDPIFTAHPAFGIAAGDISNWNTAYSWGDWSTQDFAVITSTDISNWNTAYGWGDWSVEDFASITSTDISNWNTAYGWGDWSVEDFAVITSTDISNWNTAYGWGDHALAGYLVASNNLSDLADVDTALGNLSLSTELKSLTDAEIQQLQNIDSVTISNAQWGYLGSMTGQPVEGDFDSLLADNDILQWDSGANAWVNRAYMILVDGAYIGESDSGDRIVFDYTTGEIVFTDTNISARPTGTGTNSEAFGSGASATAEDGVAVGNGARVTGNDGIAIGYNATANAGIAIGDGISVSNPTNISIGAGTVTGGGTVLVGQGSIGTISVLNSVAMGTGITVTGSYSVTLGWQAQCTANYTVALGFSADANATNTTVIGAGAISNYDSSIALGRHADTTQANEMVIGATSYEIDYLSIINSGTETIVQTLFSFQPSGSGAGSEVIGAGSSSTGTNTVVLGSSITGTANSSVLIGTGASISFNNSVAIGYGASVNQTGVAIGHSAVVGTAGTSIGTSANSSSGIAIGSNAIGSGTIAIGNTAVGTNSGLVIGNSSTNLGEIDTYIIGHNITALGSYGIIFGEDATLQGDNSIGIGFEVEVGNSLGADNCVAIGYQASVYGDEAIVIGSGSEGSGNTSIVIGLGSTSNSGATSGIAIGDGITLNEPGSVVIGSGASYTRRYGVIIGYNASGTGNRSMAIGANASAGNDYGMAVGYNSSASSTSGMAIGVEADATVGGTAIALGRGATVTQVNEMMVGGTSYEIDYLNFTISGTELTVQTLFSFQPTGSGSNSEVIGAGASSAQSNSVVIGNGASAPQATGQSESVVIGYNATALSFYNVVVGAGAQVSGTGASNSIAIGRNCDVQSSSSIAIGGGAIVTNSGGIAIGDSASASISCVVIGQDASSTNGDAVIVGRSAIASYRAVAIGRDADANVNYGVAIGYSAIVEFTGSIAIGHGAIVDDDRGIVIGYNAFIGNSAGGEDSVVIGYEAYAVGADHQTVIGASAYSEYRNAVVIGESSYTTGSDATIIGRNSFGSGIIVGEGTDAGNAIAIGNSITTTSGNTIIIGNNAQAVGGDVVVIGNSAVSDNDSVVIGAGADGNTNASCVIIGRSAEGTGGRAITFGRNSEATANSVNVGGYNTMTGIDAVGIGDGTVIAHNSSIAIGRSATTTQANEMMIGSSGYEIDHLQFVVSGDYLTIDTPAYFDTVALYVGNNPTAWRDFPDQIFKTYFSGSWSDTGGAIYPHDYEFIVTGGTHTSGSYLTGVRIQTKLTDSGAVGANAFASCTGLYNTTLIENGELRAGNDLIGFRNYTVSQNMDVGGDILGLWNYAYAFSGTLDGDLIVSKITGQMGTGLTRASTSLAYLLYIEKLGTPDFDYAIYQKDDIPNFFGGDVEHQGDVTFTDDGKIEWTKIQADSVTLNDGTSSDAVADLRTANDGNTYQVNEAAGTPGIQLIVDFINVDNFNFVRVLGTYDGSATHNVDIEIYNWTTDAWDKIDCMQSGESNSGASFGNHDCFASADTSDYIGVDSSEEGDVRIRFNHPIAGNAAHDLYLNEVSLYQ